MEVRGILLALAVLVACAPQHKSAPPPEPPVTAAARQMQSVENLRAFARLYGYVRYFHPTDRAADAEWRVLAASGAAAVRDAKTLGELRNRLDEAFRPLAPQMRLWIDGERVPAFPEAPGYKDEIVYWQHQGYVGTPLSLFAPPYRNARVGAGGSTRRRFVEVPQRSARLDEEIAPGLHLRLPLVLTLEEAERNGGKAKPVDAKLRNLAISQRGYTSVDVRQGAVIEVWNVFRHFYPYQDLVTDEWSALLDAALLDAEDDKTVDDAAATLWRLVHALQDGHGLVGHNELQARGKLPIRIELIEGKPAVTSTTDPERFAVGDVVESIDGRPVLPRINALTAQLSGSPQWRRFRAATWEAPTGPRDEPAKVKLRRGPDTVVVTARYSVKEPPGPQRPPAVHRFEDGIYYVDLTRAEWKDIKPELPAIAIAPGVVFDARGYPTDTHQILGHLIREPEDATWMHVPKFVEPDGQVVAWREIGWHLRPIEPQVSGNVVFLINAEAISFAESVLSYVDALELGTLVGSPTAGANGDIVRVDTLGGFFVVFTGMKVTRHDGSRFHVEGVRPDLPASRTLAGLRAGRDEVLEAGLDRVRAP